ncbi:MAG TPA: hypothetical protein VNI01_02960 [Elusimicrobiota bacterium]|nr:hypothetical protein [Elusimicrobiota bacterium]
MPPEVIGPAVVTVPGDEVLDTTRALPAPIETPVVVERFPSKRVDPTVLTPAAMYQPAQTLFERHIPRQEMDELVAHRRKANELAARWASKSAELREAFARRPAGAELLVVTEEGVWPGWACGSAGRGVAAREGPWYPRVDHEVANIVLEGDIPVIYVHARAAVVRHLSPGDAKASVEPDARAERIPAGDEDSELESLLAELVLEMLGSAPGSDGRRASEDREARWEHAEAKSAQKTFGAEFQNRLQRFADTLPSGDETAEDLLEALVAAVRAGRDLPPATPEQLQDIREAWQAATR